MPHILIVPALLAVAGALAFTSLLTDSVTFDETAHLTAGFSYLKTGDFRLQPEHPPLAKLLAALPLLWLDHAWPGPNAPGWQQGDYWALGRAWLFATANRERLLTAARSVMVVLLLATCLTVYALGRRIFGRQAGLLALVLAVLSPTLLAHGRLVTNDVPAALAIALTLLLFARALERLTWRRSAAALLAAAALPLVKFSWPLAVPPLLVMFAITLLRRPQRAGAPRGATTTWSRPRRALVLAGLAAAASLLAWLATWSCYAWRYDAASQPDRADLLLTVLPGPGQPAPKTREQAWETILQDGRGEPLRGPVAELVRWTRAHRLLPEAYLYGLAHTLKFTTSGQPAYLNGTVYHGGRPAYYPTAFALKTPLPTLILLLLGIAALVWRRPRVGDPTLLAGLLAFAGLFVAVLVGSEFNTGQRHLLPIYPVVLVLAGGAATRLAGRTGQVVIAAALIWSVLTVVRTHPHYLPYFNELAGGCRRGHRYLADSNIDWGQDLKRLADYARAHPDERIKLAFFGSADPRWYVPRCEALPSYLPFARTSPLGPGTYVISVNHLVGLCDHIASDQFWEQEENRRRYREIWQRFSRHARSAGQAEDRTFRQVAYRWRWGRLLHELRRREPDARIGCSLLAYRLSREDIRRLTLPP